MGLLLLRGRSYWIPAGYVPRLAGFRNKWGLAPRVSSLPFVVTKEKGNGNGDHHHRHRHRHHVPVYQHPDDDRHQPARPARRRRDFHRHPRRLGPGEALLPLVRLRRTRPAGGGFGLPLSFTIGGVKYGNPQVRVGRSLPNAGR